MQCGIDRRPARHRNGCRRKSVTRVGIVRRVRGQVLARQVAIEIRANAIDDRWIRLQAHPLLQPPCKHAGNFRPFVGSCGFLLDNGCQYQGFISTGYRSLDAPRLPFLGKHRLHQLVGLAEQCPVGGLFGEPVGLRQEQALGMQGLGPERLKQCRPVFVAHRGRDGLVGVQCIQHFASVPSFDERKRVQTYVAAGELVEQAERRCPRFDQVVASLN